MKLTLDNEELLALLNEALAARGLRPAENIDLDLGEDTLLPLAAVQGLVIDLGR